MCVSAGIGFASLILAQPSLAQITSVDSGSTVDSLKANDLSNINQNNFNVLDIMHRAQLGNPQWNPEQQNYNLDSAATAFKANQQKLFSDQKPSNSGVILIKSQQMTPQSVSLPSSK